MISKHLLSGHATETLSRIERQQLYRAALEDQELFDRLVEEEDWRQLFAAPGVREELLETLAEPKSASSSTDRPGWLRRLVPWPAGGWAMPSLATGAVAAGLLAVVLVPRWLETGPTGGAPGVGTSATEGSATEPQTELVAKGFSSKSRSLGETPSDELTAKSLGAMNLSYAFELNQPGGPRQVPGSWSFQAGDQFRLRLGIDFSAWIYLFNRAEADASYTVLYPHTEAERGVLSPSKDDLLLPADVWLTMDATPADEQLILVASAEPWSIAADRETVPVAELDAALAEAEEAMTGLNWRRSEVDDRVRLAIEPSEKSPVMVLRLLGEAP